MGNVLRELSYQRCQSLLGAGVAGRAAVMTPDGPHIVPVNYWTVGESIVIRTTPYSVLGRYGRDAVIAFEVDSIDRAEASGWSVVARGRVEMVTDAGELSDLRHEITTDPWAPGVRPMYLRLEYTELSGRGLLARVQPVGGVDAGH